MRVMARDFEALFDRLHYEPGQQSIAAHMARMEFRENIDCIRSRATYAGDMLYVDLFPVYAAAPSGLGGFAAAHKPTRAAQMRVNRRNAVRKLTALVNANFGDGNCTWITLDYGKDAVSEQDAARHVRNYIDRLRRAWPGLKYIYVTEIGEKGKIHHHVITNCPDLNLMERKWKHGGRPRPRPLVPDEQGLDAVGQYMGKDPKGRKSWTASRNLVKPVVRESDTRFSRRKVERLTKDHEAAAGVLEHSFQGYRYVDHQVRYSDYVPGVYVYARLRREKPEGGRRRR